MSRSVAAATVTGVTAGAGLGCSTKVWARDIEVVWLLRVQIALMRMATLLHITDRSTRLTPGTLQKHLLIPE